MTNLEERIEHCQQRGINAVETCDECARDYELDLSVKFLTERGFTGLAAAIQRGDHRLKWGES